MDALTHNLQLANVTHALALLFAGNRFDGLLLMQLCQEQDRLLGECEQLECVEHRKETLSW